MRTLLLDSGRKTFILFNSAILLTVFLLSNTQSYAQTTYYLQTANVTAANTVGSWRTDIALMGGGTAAANFTTSGDVFVISSTTTNASFGAPTTFGTGVTLRIDGNVVNPITGGNRTITINGSIRFISSVSAVQFTGSRYDFTLGSNATLITANPNGIFGTNCSLSNLSSAPNFSPTGSYEFNGGAQSMIGIPSTVNNLTFSGSLVKTHSIVTTVTGNLSISGTPTVTTGANISVTGSLTVGTGSTLSMGGFSLGIGTTSSITGTVNTVTASTGLKTFTGAVTVNSGGVWNLSGQNPATSFGGGITMSGTTFNNGSGPAAFSANQSLAGANSMTFGGALTPATGTTLTNSNTGTVTISSIALTGSFTQGVNSNLIATAITPFSGITGTFNANSNTNTVTYTGANVGIRATTYSSLTTNGTGIATISGTTTVNATMTVNSNTTNNSTLTVTTALSGSSTLTQLANSVLNIGGTSGITGLDASTNANTVNYTGAAQTVKAVGYRTLGFSGAGDKTIATGTSVAGNLIITSVAKADVGAGLSINVNSLTIGTLGTDTGTWGSTSSTATYKNNTFFTATTGVLNISADTRQTPTVTPTLGTYTYTNLPQGPNAATNTGTGTSYTFSYNGTGGATYGPSATQPTNAGTYTVTVTVAASTDGFYKANSSSATAFSIVARALTITGAANSKAYDGTTSSSVIPTITPGTLQGADTAAFTQTYNTKNVGTGKTMIPAGVVSDGNSGNNYSYTFVNSTNGTITSLALTITGAANSKTYDGTTSSAAVPTITSGTLQPGDTVAFTQTYDTKNVGTGKTMIPAGVVSDGNSGNNYSYTFVNSTDGTITARALTITGASNTKIYDATTISGTVPTVTPGAIQTGDTAAFTQTYDTKNVGTGKTMTPTGIMTDGNGGNNYSYTFVFSTNGTITAKALTVTANNISKCFGTTHTLGTSAFTSLGLVSPETIGSVTLTSSGASSGASVGTYSIVPSVATGGTFSASSYTITYSNGNLTVNALPTAPSGINGAICNTGTVNILASVAGGETVDWYDASLGGTLLLGGATSYTTPSISSTTFYYAEARNTTTGCVSSTRTTVTATVYVAFTSGAINTTGETICNGGTPATTIGNTTAASGGDNTITYSWRSSADGYTATISGVTSVTYLPPAGLTSTTSYRRYAKDGTCNTTPMVSSGTWTVTVNASFTSGAINTTGETICNGGTPATTIGSTTSASGGDNTITYSWRSSADGYTAAISGATSAAYLPPGGLTTTTSYRRYAKDGACNTIPIVSSGTWTVIVNAAFTSGAINTTGETICNGGTLATTIGSATAASGGDGSITYSWRFSTDGYIAAISGATSAAYLPPAGLTTTTSYQRYAKDGTCNTTSTVSSGTWTVTVRPAFTSGAINTTGETLICNGGIPATTIGSSTTASGGDNIITYSWRSSADAYTIAISGATSATYLPPSGLTTTTSYRRYAKDGTCNTTPTVSSGTWTVTVNAAFTSGTISNTGETICNGGTPTNTIGSITAASGGDGSITYSWRSSADGFTAAISGATSATYLPPSGLTTTTSYRRYAKDGTCNTIPTRATGTLSVTVRPAFTTGTISSTGETICNGGTPATTISSTTAASGGDITITYSWRSSGDGYTAAISGATSSTYLPPAGLTATTSYRRYANDGTCNTTPAVSSGTWTVTVNAAFTSGAIATTGETICSGGASATTIGSTTAASGGDGSITYSWRSSADDYTAAISGAINATYLPPAGLTTTTSYRRYAKDGTCNTTPAVSSGTWTVTVNAAFTSGAIDTTGETICNGGTSTTTIGSTTAASGGDGSITYSWRFSTNGYTTAISGATSATYLPPSGLISTTSYRRYANDGTCNTTPTVSSGTWTVTVNAAFTSGAIDTTGETICNGGTPTTTIGSTTAASGGDGSITYSWRFSTNNYTTAISGAISATYLPPSGLISTTSYRRYANDGTCNTTPTVSSGTWTVTVDATTVGGTVSSNQTICSGSQPADLNLIGQNGSVIKWESSLDAGFTSPTDIIVTSITLTGITIGTLFQDTYFRAVVQNGSCLIEESAAVLISVDDASNAGTVTGGTAICAGSTSGLLTLSSYTGTINRWEYSVSPFTSWTTIANTATTYSAGALTQTTQFRAIIQNGVCPETYSTATSVDISTTTWSSGAWSPGNPDATTAAVIESSYTSAGNIDACSLTVNNGATVVISSGDTVTLNGPLTANVGSFVTFNNNANLIQSGSTNTNTGAIIIKRNSAPLYRLDYTLWSSPVANQRLKAFSPQTLDTRFYTYNTKTITLPTPIAANTYVVVPTPSTTIFTAAKGYLIRSPNNWPAYVSPSTPGTIWQGSFTGVPNNGHYDYTLEVGVVGERFNLVGNPYPSPIDAVTFINDPTNAANTTQTLYFLRKRNGSANTSYNTWNEGVGYLNQSDQAPENDFFLNQAINIGQGFLVEASTSGTLLVFENSMRIDNHDNQFFKSSPANSTTTSIERNRIWLKAFNASGLISRALLGYVTNATLSVDNGIDGKNLNDGELDLSTLIGTVPFAIQGRPVPFDASDVVPLNLRVTTAGNYSIAIDQVDGIFTGNAQSVYLRDNLTTTIHDLNTGSYSFASTAGMFSNRFEIIYSLPLGNPNSVFTANNVVIYNQNNEFVVNTGNVIMSSIKVFDIRGRFIEEKTDINASQTTIQGGLANEVLLVQITSEDGIMVTKKVIR